MPEPEILRRCAVCGAAFRPTAVFCPQCGNAAPQSSSEAGAPEPRKSRDTVSKSLAPEKSKRNLPEAGIQPQAEKVRKVTGVFIDEATYDPSLRFVLIAVVLFVLFLVLLVLSKIMT
jgi:hypothetical protein